MNNFYHDGLGLLHLIASALAMIFGLLVIVKKKGTKQHVRLGYLYFCSMVILLSTSFLIYRLFNKFGLFHYMSVLTVVVMALGMFPIWFRWPNKNWKMMHYNFMYWSVVALYEALAAELLTRIPNTPFLGTIGAAIGLVMAIGFVIFFKYKSQWEKEIGIEK